MSNVPHHDPVRDNPVRDNDPARDSDEQQRSSESRQVLPTVRACLRDFKFHGRKFLTAADEVDLANAIRDGDPTARDKFIRSNLFRIISEARHLRLPTEELEDVIQDSAVGVIEAVDHYSGDNGTRFSTYSPYWQRNSIQKSRKNCRHDGIRIPVWAIQAAKDWTVARSGLPASATDDQIADAFMLVKEARLRQKFDVLTKRIEALLPALDSTEEEERSSAVFRICKFEEAKGKLEKHLTPEGRANLRPSARKIALIKAACSIPAVVGEGSVDSIGSEHEEGGSLLEEACPAADPDPAAELTVRTALTAGLAELSGSQLQLLRDFFYEGLTLRELAERHSCSHEAISHRLDDALAPLKSACEDIELDSSGLAAVARELLNERLIGHGPDQAELGEPNLEDASQPATSPWGFLTRGNRETEEMLDVELRGGEASAPASDDNSPLPANRESPPEGPPTTMGWGFRLR